eukprot:9237891-Alexandrium_andersonii.AAC.1
MSASLVGSEMCIRDRRSSPSPNLLHLKCMALASRPLEQRTQCSIQPLEAVSYTHLTLPTICSV